VGLTREEVRRPAPRDPGVRFAVDAYVNFARRAPWQEAVCSSLTELFAPEIHKQRLATWPEHYPLDRIQAGLAYFRNRVSQARRDVEQGLAITLDHFTTRPLQERALEILQFKLDILWAMNDAMALNGVRHDGVNPLSIDTPAPGRWRGLSPAVGAGAGSATCCSTRGHGQAQPAAPARS
jgi:coenzyme PQQ biosynthesis protein C